MKLVKFKDIETDLIMYVNPMHILFIRDTLANEMVQYGHSTNVYLRENTNPIMLDLPLDEVAEMVNDALPRMKWEE